MHGHISSFSVSGSQSCMQILRRVYEIYSRALCEVTVAEANSIESDMTQRNL